MPLPDLTDTTAWPDTLLADLRVAVQTEQERRYTLATAPAQAAQVAQQYRSAVEAALPPLQEGKHRDWTQPSGAHDSYPKGAIVSHSGKIWESQHPANVWEPGTDSRLWKDVTASAPPPEPTPSAAPFKAGESVKVGDLRTYKSVVYRAISAHTTADHWAPDVAHSLWAKN